MRSALHDHVPCAEWWDPICRVPAIWAHLLHRADTRVVLESISSTRDMLLCDWEFAGRPHRQPNKVSLIKAICIGLFIASFDVEHKCPHGAARCLQDRRTPTLLSATPHELCPLSTARVCSWCFTTTLRSQLTPSQCSLGLPRVRSHVRTLCLFSAFPGHMG